METTLITATELAAALGVDRSTIHRRIERGAITPTVRVGNRPLFTADDVERLKRGEQQLPASEAVK